jgi:multimeric flavodoxin WrbA
VDKILKVLGINGSPYIHGTTWGALEVAMNAAKESGAEIQLVHAVDYVKVFHDGRRDEHVPLLGRIGRLPCDELKELIHLILEADALIIATPVNAFGPHARIMTLLSWLQTTTDAPDYALNGKVAGLVAVCEEDGAQSAMEKMLSPLIHLGFIIPPFCTYFFNKNAKESEGDWQETDQELVGRNVVRLARMVAGAGDWNDASNSW